MKKSAAFLLAGAMVLSPLSVLADDDPEARITALESRVVQLEKVVYMMYKIGQEEGLWSENVDEELARILADENSGTTIETEQAADPSDYCFESDDCSLSFVGFDVMKEYSGNDALVVYFDFVNGSDQNKTAMLTFNVQVFQNGKEQGLAVISQSVPEYNDCAAQIMPGADPVRVAFISKLEDLSDVIVRVSPLISLGGDYIEIPLSLQ